MPRARSAIQEKNFYTLSWAHLFALLFSLVAEFERRLTSVDSEDALSSSSPDNDDNTNDAPTDDPPHTNDAPLDDPPPPIAVLVPTPPAYPPPNWRPQRRDDDCHKKLFFAGGCLG